MRNVSDQVAQFLIDAPGNHDIYSLGEVVSSFEMQSRDVLST
jgi:hypothetical protein